MSHVAKAVLSALSACAIAALPLVTPAQQPSPAADLQITKTDGTVLVSAGRNITYTIDVKNLGPAQAENVVVTDRVPEGTRYISGGKNNEGIVSFPLGKIAAGKTARASFSVAVDPSATGTLVSTATVNSSTADSNQANNSGTDSDTSIVAECDAAVTISLSPATAAAGQKVTYIVTVTNGGPSDGANLPLEATLPDGLTFDSANDGGALKDGRIQWTIDSLAAGARTQREFSATVNEGVAAGDLMTTAEATFPSDPNAENNSAVATVTVQ